MTALVAFSAAAHSQVPRILKRLRILEFTLDHEAPYFSNMRRRTSRRDSDLNGVVDVRYTGGARMLLLLEVGGRRLRVKVISRPVSKIDQLGLPWLEPASCKRTYAARPQAESWRPHCAEHKGPALRY